MSKQQQQQQQQPIVTTSVVTLLDWPTDVVSIDFKKEQQQQEVLDDVHTVILFIPGNPGLVGWYVPSLVQILQQLGPGFAVRGISYAGHGVTKEIVTVEPYEKSSSSSSSGSQGDTNGRNVQIPWTVNGQVEHKIAWIERLLMTEQQEELKGKKLIFLSHSIGGHMVQRLLVLRPDWRHQTSAMIHWMPFIRMDAAVAWQQQIKDTAARHPDVVIWCGKRLLQSMALLSSSRRSLADTAFQSSIPDPEGRALAVNLVSHPTFVRNFFELGTEEIRDLPQLPDISALRLLSSSSSSDNSNSSNSNNNNIPTFILHCPNDPWCPEEHASDITQLLLNTTTNSSSSSSNASSIHLTYASELQHDFVVHPTMVPTAVTFCVQSIQKIYTNNSNNHQQQQAEPLLSKL
mmetsp:Transcript_2199/g.3459  ORF Transcript_2199/g.3459 Transcript_2199/m.3459 type:complete len:403 (-) Transcript_2199:57-1265(-)|eukprot:CAMPEP_0119006220 /NCGR_PEP_ID=MMETSP1176-20130426/2176_1 /TAXON_ID=265551 /ORGANISM="Synedropsis recta cf, Strain CCMP1620" /LENGTH=402 /DNA_ID=CAMNT_0006958113 /DNA_START=18 /DNA_END=1226 /DNA_ORIENTATION=-